jgi:hypothetical protein
MTTGDGSSPSPAVLSVRLHPASKIWLRLRPTPGRTVEFTVIVHVVVPIVVYGLW